MLDRDEVLRIIDAGYKARAQGDKEALAAFWAPDAEYRLSGDARLLSAFPTGPGEAAGTVAEIIDLIQFHEQERITAVVDGLKAAILWRVTASTGGNRPITTELFDLFQLNEAGKVVSIVQFCDTGLLADMLAG